MILGVNDLFVNKYASEIAYAIATTEAITSSVNSTILSYSYLRANVRCSVVLYIASKIREQYVILWASKEEAEAGAFALFLSVTF